MVVLSQFVLLDLNDGSASAPFARSIEAVANIGLCGASRAVGLEMGMQIRVEVGEEAVEGCAKGG